jgi:hypothetical protein
LKRLFIAFAPIDHLYSRPKRLFLLPFGLAGITWLFLEIAVRHELAQSPGQDSLGVAALGMLFGFPILAFLGFGAVALVGSAIAFLRGFIASRKNAL